MHVRASVQDERKIILHQCLDASRSDEDGNWKNGYGLETLDSSSTHIQQTVPTLCTTYKLLLFLLIL